jgi:hypothetical protein
MIIDSGQKRGCSIVLYCRIEKGRLAANLHRFMVRPDSGRQPGSDQFYQQPWLGELPRLIYPNQVELFAIMMHLYNSTSNTGAGNAHAF